MWTEASRAAVSSGGHSLTTVVLLQSLGLSGGRKTLKCDAFSYQHEIEKSSSVAGNGALASAPVIVTFLKINPITAVPLWVNKNCTLKVPTLGDTCHRKIRMQHIDKRFHTQ